VEGNSQEGIDLFADMQIGQRWAFQNKRWKQFGPQDVENAVGATTYKAEKYILLLSREATTGVREKVATYPGWDIWDRCDLSNKVRQLPLEAARRFVDDHFGPWWRRAFLGLDAIAAFLAPNDFFRELLDTGRLFHHSFDLIGREGRLASLVEHARPSRIRVTILPGRGGIGKTRLLRAFAQRVEEDGAEPSVRFLVEGIPLTQQSLDELPRQPCVVVVDDAHRCDGLGLLLAYTRHRPDIKLVLATRPHETNRIRGELTRAGFDTNEVADLPLLTSLSRAEVRELARAALGPDWQERVDIVDRLASVTEDCPLATVVGGRLLAENAIPPELLTQDQLFRRAVFDRFRDEQLGHLGPEFAPELARQVLEVLAAVNPIPAEGNQPVLQRVAKQVGADSVAVARLVGELERVALLVRRGSRLRLTPDVFADHLLAGACLTPQNQSTGFAEQVFEGFRDVCPNLVLRNLAELDWRVRSAAGEEARLLDEMWVSIETVFQTGTCGSRVQILDLVSETAYYQPRRVLALARMAIRCPAPAGNSELTPVVDGSWYNHGAVLEHLPELLHRCAYTPDTLPECLALLWELSLHDDRSPQTCSRHPIRVLQQIAKYEYFGQWWVGDEVARQVTCWFRSPAGAPHRRQLLDILDSLLAKTGESLWSEGHSVRCVSFHIPYEAVRDSRRAAFAILRDCLDTGDVSLQLRALTSLGQALNGPMPSMGLISIAEVLADWEPDQLEILNLLAGFLGRRHEPVVQLGAWEAVRFQAAHGPRPAVRQRAQGVCRLVEDSFEVRLTRRLLSRHSGWDDLDDHEPGVAPGAPPAFRLDWHRRRHEPVVLEVWQRYPTAEAAFAYVCGLVRSLREAEAEVCPRHVVWYLLEARPDAAAVFAERILAEPDSPLSDCFRTCLVHLRRCQPIQATALACAAIDSGRVPAARDVGYFYWWDWPDGAPLADEDVDVIRRLLAHPDIETRECGLGSLHRLIPRSATLPVELALAVDLGDSEKLAEQLARLTDPGQPDFLGQLRDDQLRILLRKFDAVGRLNHWVCALLQRIVQNMPDDVLDLFLRRINDLDTHGYRTEYEVVPDQLDRVFAPLAGSARQADLVRRVRDQTLTGGRWRRSVLPDLYRAVSGNFGPGGLAALREWLGSGEPERVAAVAMLLRRAGPRFVFDNHEFVADILSRAAAAGNESLERVRSDLLALAFSTGRHGLSGQPFPQDIDSRDRAIAVLERLPQGTRVYSLFQAIRQNAESRIREEVTRGEEVDG